MSAAAESHQGLQAQQQHFFLTRENFMFEPVGPADTPLYFFFGRGDIVCKNNDVVGFRNMRRELRIVLKILCYIAHSLDGVKVYLLYLEPHVESLQARFLGPYLRCALTNDFCLLFVVPKPPSAAVAFVEDVRAAADEPDMTAMMVTAAKQLICVDVKLIAPTDAFVMRTDHEKTAELLGKFDYATWTYSAKNLDKKGSSGRKCLDKPLQMSETTLTQNALVASVTSYFQFQRTREPSFLLGADETLDFLFGNLTDPLKSPAYCRYRMAHDQSPYVAFLERAEVQRDELIIFSYSIEHLINKDNFNFFENTRFLCFPDSNDATFGDAIQRMLDTQGTETDPIDSKDRDFRLVWPHLHTFVKIAESFSDITEPLEALGHKVHLFRSMLLTNSSGIPTEPTKSLYQQLDRLLPESACGSRPLVDLKSGKMGCFRCVDPTKVTKVGDHAFLSLVFCDTFGLVRNVQAFMSMVHIMHTTAPKWKSNKVMIINHTRGGTGKSHTMHVLRRLFGRIPELFSGFSTITDTVLKYSSVTIGKVMVMDDVGLSQAQQKTARREDNIMCAQFKSLLDTGYTNNFVTEKDGRSNTFKVSNKLMVANAAFIWNANTVEAFSDALLDRCLVLGSEPLVSQAIIGRPEVEVNRDAARHCLEERFHGLYLRQHYFQTLMYTLCIDDSMPSARAHAFAADLVRDLSAKFPLTKNTCSFLRSDFKIMDMIMAESVRCAVSAVLDYWVPPWTIAPRMITGETCGEYTSRLDRARAEAFEHIEPAEVLVEVVAQTKLFMPSSTVQIIAINFNQSTSAVFSIIFKITEAAMLYNAKDVFVKAETTDGPALTINYVKRICPELFTVDRFLVASGKDLWFKRETVTVRLVEDLTETTIKLNGFFILELYKIYGRALIERTHSMFKDIFREALVNGDRLKTIVWSAQTRPIKNFLFFLSAVNTEANPDSTEVAVGHDAEDFYISPCFLGIATALYYEMPEVPAERFGNYINRAYHGGTYREVPTVRTAGVPPRYTFFDPKICWFSVEYLRDTVDRFFQHSKCGTVPSGDTVGFFEADTPSRGPSWEMDEAVAVYQKYLGDTATAEDLRRYICHSKAADEPAVADPYLDDMRRTLPTTTAGRDRVLRARYGERRRFTSSHKRQRSPEPEPSLRRVLSVAGTELLRQMRNSRNSDCE